MTTTHTNFKNRSSAHFLPKKVLEAKRDQGYLEKFR